ncbi:methyltransferase family protein [Kitasatospora sp. LaBMicrA B282]|uniref:methyltransferase family protein n=1 Tax=Kitasatospora sp. LaBMicrA B282 TaxID=3420949 RepID=UPI003D1045F0
MDALRTATGTVAWICVAVFVIAWLLAAVHFGAPHRAAAGRRGGLPGGWLATRLAVILVVVVVRVVAGRGGSIWHHLEYWQPVLGVLGAVLAVAATALLLWARWVLGRMWASVPLVQEHHELVTDGPYAIVRHPIYTGLLGLVYGGMLADAFGVWVLYAVLVTPWLVNRVRVEDGLMAGEFGAQYTAYRERVPALLPSPRSLRRRPPEI